MKEGEQKKGGSGDYTKLKDDSNKPRSYSSFKPLEVPPLPFSFVSSLCFFLPITFASLPSNSFPLTNLFFLYCRLKVTRIHTNPPISSPSYYSCGPHPWCHWYDFLIFFGVCLFFHLSLFFSFLFVSYLILSYPFVCWTDDLQI